MTEELNVKYDNEDKPNRAPEEDIKRKKAGV